MTLRPEQWDRLLAEYWGKQWTCLEGVVPEPLLTERELLDAIRHLAARARTWPKGALPGSDAKHLYYFASDANASNRIEAVDPFPLPSEQDLETYYRRVSTAVGCGFAFIGLDLQAYLPTLWRRLIAFVAPLAERVGQPPYQLHASVFLGQYSATPTGVHKDTSHVFTFLVYGRKRIRLWPGDFHKSVPPEFSGSQRSYYERYIDQSSILEAGVNDLIYWPPTAWHLAENDELSATITIHWDVRDNYQKTDRGPMTRWLAEVIADRAKQIATEPPANNEMPGPVRAALDRLVAAQRGPGYVEHVWKRWLERTSKMSFRETPELAAAGVCSGDTFVIGEGTTFEWVRAPSGNVIAATSGLSFELEYFDGIDQVLDRISRPPAWNMATLLHAVPAAPDKVQRAVETCVRHGVVLPAT